VDRRALTRLRIAFLLLGAALLVPLGWLLRSVDARLEAQRRLRHELVAERIFDEMEGELTALLAREDARPSAAYAATSTRVENWAPFVVGYFTRDARGVQIVAKPQLEAARVSRLEATLKRAAARGAAERASGAGPTSDAFAKDTARLAEAEAAAKLAEQRRAAAAASANSARYAEEPALEEPAPDDEEQKRKHDGSRAIERKGAGASQGLGAAPAAAPVPKVQAAPEAVLKQLNRAADSRKREVAPNTKSKGALSPDDNDPLSGGLE
jgi:colicin import membrane protein